MSVNSLRFEARWSRLVWLVTVFVLVLVAVAEILLVRTACTFSVGEVNHSAAMPAPRTGGIRR